VIARARCLLGCALLLGCGESSTVRVTFNAAPGPLVDDLTVAIALDGADGGALHPLPFDGGRASGSFLIPVDRASPTRVQVTLSGHDDSGAPIDGQGAVETVPGREVPLDIALGRIARYPRLAAFSIGGKQDYDTLNFRQAAAKYGVVVVAFWEGWQGDRSMPLGQAMADIKSRSTVGTRLFVYVIDDQWLRPAPAGDDVAAALDANGWWLYLYGTSGSVVPSSYAGHSLCNSSSFSPTVNGQTWMQWKAAYDYRIAVTGDARDSPNPALDGFLLASARLQPAADGDWNRDGTVDSASDPAIAAAFRAGVKGYFDAVRALWPGSIQLAQTTGWEQPGATVGVLDGATQGGFIGTMLGKSYTPEATSGFAAMMASYSQVMDAFAAPKLGIFAFDDWPAGDYQSMRYGLGAALMDDGYFFIDDGNYDLDHELWFDEFDVDLGRPLVARQTGAWQQGVWRRDFEKGVALVNPKGNGAQTVALGGTFTKLTGTQAPSVNDGSSVTSVTLADRDGILLLR
jgi:hypothetical protein